MNNLKKPEVRIFKNKLQLGEFAAREFEVAAKKYADESRNFSVALSGGSTPALFFQALSTKQIDWDYVQIFWGDERCVSPDHQDSNYLMTRLLLLDKIDIPEGNVHRIRGEGVPGEEAARYSDEILRSAAAGDEDIPRFDWIVLGMGSDGHTASIFPGFRLRAKSQGVCAVAAHPETGQERITFTLPVINNARRVSFMVAGISKAPVVSSILNKTGGYLDFPAARVNPTQGFLEWFLDAEAAPADLQNR